MDTNESDGTVDAVWCIDSESGVRYLLDRKTGHIIARKDDDGNIINDRG